MLNRATKVSINNQSGITALRADKREICDSGRFAFPGTATDKRNGIGFGIWTIEFDIRAQDPIGFGIRRVRMAFRYTY